MPSKKTAKPASMEVGRVLRRLVEDKPIAHLSIRSLDDLIGGVKKGRLILIPGEPGAGKTTLTNQITDDLAAQGVPVLYFSYEIDPAQLIAKSLVRLGGGSFTVADIAGCDSQPAIQTALESAVARYKEYADNIYYYANTSTTVMDISIEIGRYEREHGVSPVVFVDYIQAVPPSDGVKTSDERLQIKSVMADLRNCATKHDVAIIAVSSVGREHYDKQTTGLKCLGGSSALEYGSDTVVLLALEGKGEQRIANLSSAKRPVVVSTLKNRYGALGSARLIFDPARALFSDR